MGDATVLQNDQSDWIVEGVAVPPANPEHHLKEREEVLHHIFGDVGELIDVRKTYSFRSFWDRDDCYHMLKYLMERCQNREIDGSLAEIKSIRDVPARTADSSVPVNAVVTAGTSVELPLVDGSVASTPALLAAVPQPITSVAPTTTTSNSHKSILTRLLRSGSNANLAQLTAAGGAATNTDISSSTHSEDLSTIDEETDMLIGDEDEDGENEGNDLAAIFDEEVKKFRLATVVISEPLPLTVREFFLMFLDDEAPFPVKKYQESVKDTQIQCEQWQSVSQKNTLSREIKYIKQVPAPYNKCRVTKLQRLRKFGDLGLVYCGSARMEDIPAADTFSVEDMMSVRSISSDPERPQVLVEITFEVKFIKGTMLRYMIESNTNSEMKKWLADYFAHLRLMATTNKDAIAGIASRSQRRTSLTATSAAAVVGAAAGAGGVGASSSAGSSPSVLGGSARGRSGSRAFVLNQMPEDLQPVAKVLELGVEVPDNKSVDSKSADPSPRVAESKSMLMKVKESLSSASQFLGAVLEPLIAGLSDLFSTVASVTQGTVTTLAVFVVVFVLSVTLFYCIAALAQVQTKMAANQVVLEARLKEHVAELLSPVENS